MHSHFFHDFSDSANGQKHIKEIGCYQKTVQSLLSLLFDKEQSLLSKKHLFKQQSNQWFVQNVLKVDPYQP